MKRFFWVVVLFVVTLWGAFVSRAETFDHTLKEGPMQFSWSVEAGSLRVQLTGKTTGWVGVGFNPEEMMKGANFILGYVKNGKVKVVDHFGHSDRNHKSDTKLGGQNDTSGVSGSEKKGVTEITFTIPLKTGDEYDTVIDPTGMTTVLLSMGSGRDSIRSVHGFKSIYRVNLSTGRFEKMP